MNMYRIPALLFIAVAFALSSLHAQQIIYSPYDKFDFRTGEFTVAGKVADMLYVYRGSADGYYLDAYNDAMQRQATVILDFLPRRSFGTRFITYNDKIIVLHQVTESGRVVTYGPRGTAESLHPGARARVAATWVRACAGDARGGRFRAPRNCLASRDAAILSGAVRSCGDSRCATARGTRAGP